MKGQDWSWKAHEAPRSKSKRRKHNRKLPKSVRRWMALRAKVFKTYGKQCMKCGSTENIEVDHIKPRSKFPELRWDFDNLQVLCRRCNILKWNYHDTDYREDFFAAELDKQLLSELRDWL